MKIIAAIFTSATLALVVVSSCTTTVMTGGVPLPEHPRPDWERQQWVNLNGAWDFGFEDGTYDKTITVPFGWGSTLSGVKDEKGKDTGYYRRKVCVPQEWRGKRIFLVVGAADYETEFSFDGRILGKHVGGYTPFEFELTDYVEWGKEQSAEFKIYDPDFLDARVGSCLIGKQGYGNVRGIWQTVYLEARGKNYIESARFTPSVAKSSVTAEIRLASPADGPIAAEVKMDGKTTKVPFARGECTKVSEIEIASPKLWDLDNPYLYDVTLSLGDDTVKSYFGFREIGTCINVNGDPYVTLNGKPIYLQLALDQGYHPQGYYTFPTDESMKNEILISNDSVFPATASTSRRKCRASSTGRTGWDCSSRRTCRMHGAQSATRCLPSTGLVSRGWSSATSTIRLSTSGQPSTRLGGSFRNPISPAKASTRRRLKTALLTCTAEQRLSILHDL